MGGETRNFGEKFGSQGITALYPYVLIVPNINTILTVLGPPHDKIVNYIP